MPAILAGASHHFFYLTLLAVLVSGCVFPGDDSGFSPPCDCPTSKQPSTPSTGPGLELRNASSASDGGLFVLRPFRGDEADPDQLLNRIRQAAFDSGFDPVIDEEGRIELMAESLALKVNTAERSDLPRGISVTVEYFGEDSPEVAELLEPLRSALEERGRAIALNDDPVTKRRHIER